jgi:23S rRNA pseudouridine1911/1915/1917 synthase
MFGQKRKYKVTEAEAGKRLDSALAALEKEVSRQYFQKMIKEGRVYLGKRYLKPSFAVNAGDLLEVDFPEPVKLDLEPADIPLQIVYEDKDLLVIDKQPGLVVHPAEHGKFMGKSLVNAVLAHAGESLKGIGGVLRPGIVHRLDKDTSGLIVVAKNEVAHQGLVSMFKARQVSKRYQALLIGNFPHEKGRIEAPIGRHLIDRKKMSINGINTKNAITEFKVIKRYKSALGWFTLVDIGLLTGRTHQIRVHFESVGFPLAGDKTYGREKMNAELQEICGLDRQFLHAYELSFVHPVSKKKLDLKVDLAPDLQNCLKRLEA